MALHQRHLQSCSLRTLPQVRSQTAQRALTGRFPSSHWWGMATCGQGQPSPLGHHSVHPAATGEDGGRQVTVAPQRGRSPHPHPR